MIGYKLLQFTIFVMLISFIEVKYSYAKMTPHRLSLQATKAVILGTVYDSFGRTIESVEVELIRNEKKLVNLSDKDGKYQFQLLEKGIYTIRTLAARKMQNISLYSEKIVEIKENIDYVVNLCPLMWVNDIPIERSNISGKIITDDTSTNKAVIVNDKPRLHGIVQVINPFSLELLSQAAISEGGVYALQVPCFGYYLIQVLCSGYEPEAVKVRADQLLVEKNIILRKNSP
jgi:hypothetical protein